MVYTELIIVAGIVVNKNEISPEADYVGIEIDEDGYVQNTEFNDKRMEVFSFPCCSKSQNEKYIIGFKLHTYYHKVVKCGDCDRNSCCDTCIGETNNGNYDVEKILDGPVEVNIRHLCLYCFSDNKVDLGAPLKTCKLNENCFDEAEMKENKKKSLFCKTCNRKPDERYSPEECLSKFGTYKLQLKKEFKGTTLENKPVKFYYMVNDCISCT